MTKITPPLSGASAAVLSEVHADTAFTNSAAENTLASLTLPAGRVAVGDRLRTRFGGELLNNTAGSLLYTWRFKIGATGIFGTPSVNVATATTKRLWVAEFEITVESLTAERVLGTFNISNNTSIGMSFTQNAQYNAVGYGTAAEDLSAGLTIALSCQMGAADANGSVTLHSAALYLYRK